MYLAGCLPYQKNGAIVRSFVGYDRFTGERVSEQLGEVYQALRLFINCFQPSMKLLSKSLGGETVRRVYDPAKTPLQSLLFSGGLSEQRTRELREAAQTLDPLALLEYIDALRCALLRCAGSSSPQPVVRFSPARPSAFPMRSTGTILARGATRRETMPRHDTSPGARERCLLLTENTRRALRVYLIHQRVRMGKSGTQDPLFLSERCKQMTPNLITQFFHRLSLQAGITEQWITPSMLRDTFAVQYLQAGGNLRALQEQLGLEDAVSVKRYEHFCQHARPQP